MKVCILLRSALALRALSPPLALMTAQETALSGAFRNAHQARPLACLLSAHTPCAILRLLPGLEMPLLCTAWRPQIGTPVCCTTQSYRHMLGPAFFVCALQRCPL